MRLILDGTVVKVRLDKKATSISLLVALGVRRDGQKVLLAVKSMGGESEAAWRGILDALHGAQAEEPDCARAEAARRGDCGRLYGHDLCGQSAGHREAAQGIRAQVARQVRGRREEPGGGRRPALHVHAAARRAMEIGAHHQRHRAPASGVQAPHQDADRAALGRDRSDAVLGAACHTTSVRTITRTLRFRPMLQCALPRSQTGSVRATSGSYPRSPRLL